MKNVFLLHQRYDERPEILILLYSLLLNYIDKKLYYSSIKDSHPLGVVPQFYAAV